MQLPRVLWAFFSSAATFQGRKLQKSAQTLRRAGGQSTSECRLRGFRPAIDAHQDICIISTLTSDLYQRLSAGSSLQFGNVLRFTNSNAREIVLLKISPVIEGFLGICNFHQK
jgi:hypothetical protein